MRKMNENRGMKEFVILWGSVNRCRLSDEGIGTEGHEGAREGKSRK